MSFVDRTAGLRSQLASSSGAADPSHSAERARLYNAKAALVKEGEQLIASAGPAGELSTAKLARADAINHELDAVSSRLGEIEAEREQLKHRLLNGPGGPGLSLPPDSLRIPLGLVGLSKPPLSAAQLFGGGSMDGWDSPAQFLQAVRFGMHDSRFQLMAAGGMTEGVPSEGGFLVPQEHANNLYDASIENEIVRPRAQVEVIN